MLCQNLNGTLLSMGLYKILAIIYALYIKRNQNKYERTASPLPNFYL